MKRWISLVVVIVWFMSGRAAFAADRNVVTFVSPVRGREFWRVNKEIDNLTKQRDLLAKKKVKNTWLLQFDALLDEQIVEEMKNSPEGSELGIFMEVTPKLALAAYVNYDWMSEKWERADKLFLSGYERDARRKLIDAVFEKFKEVFGNYPKSIGAWHIDGWSLNYMRETYGIVTVLGLSDQYIADGYQVWGQFVGLPYYPNKLAIFEPAASARDKLDVVKIQWAPRHPVLGFGRNTEALFSAQVNDYLRFHKQGNTYFKNLIESYTKNVEGKLSQITLGLEVGELEDKYFYGLERQLNITKKLGIDTLTMSEFGEAYKNTYSVVSPASSINSSWNGIKVSWYQSPWYRARVVKEGNRVTLTDLRIYHRSGYLEDDQLRSDKRESFFRVVPAIVDQIALGNSIDVTGSEIVFGEKEILVKGDVKLPLMEKERTNEGTVYDASFEPILAKENVSKFERIISFLRKLIPDIRWSVIEGKRVVGIRVGYDRIWGIWWRSKIGIIKFEFPTLEAFGNLDKWRKSESRKYARWEDELNIFALDRKADVVLKEGKYGWESLVELLKGQKLFENSMYLIPKK